MIKASAWYVSRHPVVSNAGIYYLVDLVTHALNKEPEPNTGYLFFNRKHTIGIALVISKDSGVQVPVRFRPHPFGSEFAVKSFLSSRDKRHSMVEASQRDVQRLLGV